MKLHSAKIDGVERIGIPIMVPSGHTFYFTDRYGFSGQHNYNSAEEIELHEVETYNPATHKLVEKAGE